MKIFWILTCILSLASCTGQKQNTTAPAAGNNTASNNNGDTKFGVFFLKMQSQAKMNGLKNLGCMYTRMAVRVDEPGEAGKIYSKLYQQGYKMFVNLEWGLVRQADGSQQAQPFPTDTVRYERNLRTLLDNLKSQPPFIFIVGREPTNLIYHSGPMSDYINQLRVTIRVCHEYGFLVADGGLHPQGLSYWAYQDFLKRGLKDSAEYIKQFFTNEGKAYLKSNNSSSPTLQRAEEYMTRVKELADAYRNLDLDYVNIHIYDPSSFDGDGIKASDYSTIIHYYSKYTGKPVITDAFSLTEFSPSLLTSVLNEVKRSGIKYAIYFSGDDRLSKPLTDENGNLNELGKIYKTYVH